MTAGHDLRRGAVYMVGSALLFTLMSVGVKVSAQTLPNTVVVFFRSAGGLLALLPWLGLHELGTRRLGDHLIRAVAGTVSMYLFFYAIAHMRLADAVLLNYSLPLFMPFVESLWLKEPFPRRLWRPIVLGFAGIVVILRPGGGVFEPVAVFGLASATLAAIAQVGVRRLTRTEPVTRIVFYFCVVSTVASAVPAAVLWQSPPASAWLVLVALGVVATAGQLFLTRAYACAPASRVGPFIYTSVVFAAVLDAWVFGKAPDRFSIAGAALVAAASILALRGQGASLGSTGDAPPFDRGRSLT